MRKLLALTGCVLLCCALTSCAGRGNAVAKFLENAEVQYEGDAQKANLTSALKDILALNAQDLRARRYADYEGRPNQWDLPTLFQRHFVPDDQSKTLGEHFYEDIGSFAVKMKINNILMRM